MSGSTVSVEALLLGVREGALVFERHTVPLTGQAIDLVWSLAGHDGADPTVCIHSTSWRQTGETVILTWVVAPGPVGAAAQPVAGPVHGRPTGRLDVPTGDDLSVASVLTHAIGHLRYLAEKDQSRFLQAWHEHAELWDRIWMFEPTVAGRLATA